MSDNIHVSVRMRPLISREVESKAAIHWKAKQSTIYQTVSPSVAFHFDRVFQGHESNEAVYNEFCSPIVKSVIDGFNGTIFVYGQTSSGKTFTMMGDDQTQGIIRFTLTDLFKLIQNMPEREFLLRVSYMEIYNETVRDLLSDKSENLKVTEDQDGLIKVNGLTEHIVQEEQQVLDLNKLAERKRRTGETRMNEKSSRSHSIFRMIVESGLKGESDAAINVSHFNLVDLAGSERARQTKATGARFQESIKINTSLLTLSQVISKLSEKVANDQFINYRDSNLTRILKNSLGGNARTAIICTVTPASLEETVSTLKFAERAKRIRNKPKVNEVLTEEALLKKYANDIKKLTKELEATKEEKALENKKLQEQIQTLKKQFVTQMVPEIKTRSIRRETWGGCHDTARLRLDLLALRETLESTSNLPVLEEEPSFSSRSFTPQRKLMPPMDDRNSLPCPGRKQLMSMELPTLEEESEFDMDAFDGDDSFFQSTKYSSKPSYDAPPQTDATVQTELELPNIQSFESENRKLLEQIISLKRELSELHEFTTLERQLLRAKNRHSLDSKSRLSIDLNITELEQTKENSQLIITQKEEHESQSDIRTDMTIAPEEPVCALENENAQDENIFCSQPDVNELKTQSENESEVMDYLANTIKILTNRKNIDPASPEDKLNAHHKVMLNMFALVMQYQCLTFKGSFKTDLTEKIKEISEILNKIFQTFGNNSESEDLVEDFMYKTDVILKEIDMFSLDADDGKQGILNQSLFPESFLQRHSFEESVINVSEVRSPRYTPLKPIAEDFMSEVLTDEKEKTVIHSVDDALKERISALERDIETYRKSVEDFTYENELKEKQINIFKDKVEVQEVIINGLKDEITLLSDERNSTDIDMITKSSQTDDFSDPNINSISPTLVDCYAQTSNELCNIKSNIDTEILDVYTQTESLDFTYNSQSFIEVCDIIPNKNRSTFHVSTECSDYYSQIEDSTRLVDTYYQAADKCSVSNNVVHIDCDTQTEDFTNENSKNPMVFEDCSSQTTEDLLKFIVCSNNVVETSSQTECVGFSVDQTTQVLDSSFIIPPSYNTVGTCTDDSLEVNSHGENNLNSSIKDATVNEVEPNLIKEKSGIEDDRDCLEVSDKTVIKDCELETNLKVTLNDLIQLRIFALEFMKRDMQNYLGDIEFFENSESSPLLDQIKIEVTALKELLMRLEFFITCQNEHNENFNNMLEENNMEKITLQDQLDSIIKEKDAEYLNLNNALMKMENAISELNQNVRNSENIGKVDSGNESIDNSTPLCYVNSLNKIILNVSYLFNRKTSSMVNLSVKLQEAENKLKSLQEKNRMPLKISKYVQTSGDERLQHVSKQLEEADVCVEDLKNEISNLTSKLENIYNDKKVLESNLEASNREMIHLKESSDAEKQSWTENTKQCVKRVEEKCDQMMIEQENKFFDDINKLKLEQRLQLLDKSKNHKVQQEELKTKIEKLKKELAEMDSKLGEEVQSRCKEKFQLEGQIRTLEENNRNYSQINSTMKDKYKRHLAEFQRLKSKINKPVENKETQTNSTQKIEDKMNSQTKVINNPIYVPDLKPKPCDNCALLMQKVSDLKKSHSSENPSVTDAAANSKLRKEVYDLKADISSLKRSNESLVKETVSLKQELSSKLVLLRSCQCRLNPKPSSQYPGMGQAAIKEKNELHQSDLKDTKSSEIRNEFSTDPEDILKLEVVQKAIQEAKLQERAFLSSGSGPDSMIKCHYMMRKLNKREKEIKELEEKIKQLDAIIRKNAQKHNRQKVEAQENHPSSPLKERHLLKENHFKPKPKLSHPFPEGAVPIVQPKKILKEMNRKFPTPDQDNAVKKPSEKKSNICDLDINNAPLSNPSSAESGKKAENNENQVRDKEAERKRQIELLTGGTPECRQQ